MYTYNFALMILSAKKFQTLHINRKKDSIHSGNLMANFFHVK